ncbi:MAG TPA: glycosyltransferase family 87 protein [Xanthobacteraceae bacterium]|jgi:alpha-1,2-mannosyltransferase|nr:glycosyltransferase family 87 protein [Xanthobacteraceae bacterium]
MSALQKKLLLSIALLLVLQTGINLARYFSEVTDFGGDFFGFWQAAQRVRQGDIPAIYDPDAWRNLLSVGTPDNLYWFVYPPFALFGLWPFGHMTYNEAVLVWSLAPLPFYFGLMILLAKRSDLGRETKLAGQNPASPVQAHAVLLAMALPLLSANLFSGQTGTFVAVFFLGAAYFWRRHSILAGICIGLLAVKPQMGLLLPFALAAAGQWRTIAAAAATIAVLVAAATAWLGTAIWFDYLHMTQVFGNFIGQGFSGIRQLALSPYVSLQAVGVHAGFAAMLQAGIALTALVTIIFVFWRNAVNRAGDDEMLDLRLALLITGTLLATPYALSYDTPVLILAILPLIARAWREGWDALELAAVTALVVLPYAQPIFVKIHVPFGFCALLLSFCVLYRRYRRDATVSEVRVSMSHSGVSGQ